MTCTRAAAQALQFVSRSFAVIYSNNSEMVSRIVNAQ